MNKTRCLKLKSEQFNAIGPKGNLGPRGERGSAGATGEKKSSSDPLCLDSDVKKVPRYTRKIDIKRRVRVCVSNFDKNLTLYIYINAHFLM